MEYNLIWAPSRLARSATPTSMRVWNPRIMAEEAEASNTSDSVMVPTALCMTSSETTPPSIFLRASSLPGAAEAARAVSMRARIRLIELGLRSRIDVCTSR